MHYKNGREAKIGDQVVGKDIGGNAFGGILVATTPGAESCNGRVLSGEKVNALPYVNLSDCLHVDDAFEEKPSA